MVRNYVKKRTKPAPVEGDLLKATKAVLEKKIKLRRAAKEYGVNPTTLLYRVKKAKERLANGDNILKNTYIRTMFTTDEESMLTDCIFNCSMANNSLTAKLIRTVAFLFAKKIGRAVPPNWEKEELAGIEWYRAFKKRHKNLSLSKQKRDSGVKDVLENEEEFFQIYRTLLAKHKISGQHIFYLNETAISTITLPSVIVETEMGPQGVTSPTEIIVQVPDVKVEISEKVGVDVVPGENGSFVMCAIVGACGVKVPPIFVIPSSQTVRTAIPPGSLVLDSPSSGWMDTNHLTKTLEHIQKQTQCSQSRPILLLLNCHDNHCSLDDVLCARVYGIIMLTLPLLSTDLLQPLDVTVMGPFKDKVASGADMWISSNPERAIGIDDLLGFVVLAYTESFTKDNISDGFVRSGLWPFTRGMLTNEDDVAAGMVAVHGNEICEEGPLEVVVNPTIVFRVSAVMKRKVSGSQLTASKIEELAHHQAKQLLVAALKSMDVKGDGTRKPVSKVTGKPKKRCPVVDSEPTNSTSEDETASLSPTLPADVPINLSLTSEDDPTMDRPSEPTIQDLAFQQATRFLKATLQSMDAIPETEGEAEEPATRTANEDPESLRSDSAVKELALKHATDMLKVALESMAGEQEVRKCPTRAMKRLKRGGTSSVVIEDEVGVSMLVPLRKPPRKQANPVRRMGPRQSARIRKRSVLLCN